MNGQIRRTAAAVVLGAAALIGLRPSVGAAAVTIFEDQRQFRYYVDGFYADGSTPWHHENITGVGSGQDWSIGASGFGTNMGTASYNITYGGPNDLVTPLFSGFGPSNPGIGSAITSMTVDAGTGLSLRKVSGPYTTGWINYGGGTTFEVVEPTPWTIDGTAASNVYTPGGRVVVGVQLFNIVSHELLFDFQREGGGAGFSQNFASSGVLQPGYWQFNFVAMVEYSDFFGSGPYEMNATSLLHATFAVPEPASAALLALPALACMRRRRR
jgi:hypothetical protein